MTIRQNESVHLEQVAIQSDEDRVLTRHSLQLALTKLLIGIAGGTSNLNFGKSRLIVRLLSRYFSIVTEQAIKLVGVARFRVIDEHEMLTAAYFLSRHLDKHELRIVLAMVDRVAVHNYWLTVHRVSHDGVCWNRCRDNSHAKQLMDVNSHRLEIGKIFGLSYTEQKDAHNEANLAQEVGELMHKMLEMAA